MSCLGDLDIINTPSMSNSNWLFSNMFGGLDPCLIFFFLFYLFFFFLFIGVLASELSFGKEYGMEEYLVGEEGEEYLTDEEGEGSI